MKKIVYLLLFLFITTNSYAQWYKTTIPADELLGITEVSGYIFHDDEGCISFLNNGMITIWTNEGLFDYDVNREIEVLMGVYDGNDRLVSKGRYIFKVRKDGSTIWAIKFMDIYNLVVNKNCTVRVVIDRYCRSSLDIKTKIMENVLNI